MEFHVDVFSGPLELLLRLIQKNEIDIYDIPISELTDQYLDAIKDLPQEMEELSEFLVMAATLLEIKSRMLLPKPKLESDEEPEDPREALVQKLLAYKNAQDLAERLVDLTPDGPRMPGHGDRELLMEFAKAEAAKPITDMIPLDKLAQIFTDVMTRKADKTDVVRSGYGDMAREKITLADKVSHIRNTLRRFSRVSVFELFENCQSKHEMVVTFLAVLEMIRQSEICAEQNDTFEDIIIVPSDNQKATTTVDDFL